MSEREPDKFAWEPDDLIFYDADGTPLAGPPAAPEAAEATDAEMTPEDEAAGDLTVAEFVAKHGGGG